jgi:phage shock protein A
MGVFGRLSDLIAANLNALLDRAENPEVMLAQIIRELESGRAAAREHAATTIAAERRLGRELEQMRAQAARWKEEARTALAAGREDLARRALVRKREVETLLGGHEDQYTAAREAADAVRATLRAFETRLTEARRKQRSLVARHRACQARLRLDRAGGAGILSPDTASGKLERLEGALSRLEDELQAKAELDRLLADSAESTAAERDPEIEKELKELRDSLGSK